MERLRCQDVQLGILLCSQPTSAGPLSMGGHGQFAQGFQFARRTRTKNLHAHPFQNFKMYYTLILVVGKKIKEVLFLKKKKTRKHSKVQEVGSTYHHCDGGQEIGAGAIPDRVKVVRVR